MILCLDIGNSQIVGGVFDDADLRIHFRLATQGKPTSDELGVFLRSVLRENGIDPAASSGPAAATRSRRAAWCSPRGASA
jgi:type III pantothenate kinase